MIEWNHLLTLFNISHFYLYCLHRSDGKTSSTRIRRRTCHSQITTHDESDRKNAFVRVFFSLIKPGRGRRMDLKILENLFSSDDRTGKLVETSRSDYSKEDYGRSWSSQEWKSGAAEPDR